MGRFDSLFNFGGGGGTKTPNLVGGGARQGYIGSSQAQRSGLTPVDGALQGMANYGVPTATYAAGNPVAKAGTNMFNSGEGFFGTMLGSKDANGIESQGWGGLALGGIQGISDIYKSMKQFGLAEDAFEESQRQYNQDYAAQKQITNADMEDRQRARVASNSGAYQSVSDYMAKNGIR